MIRAFVLTLNAVAFVLVAGFFVALITGRLDMDERKKR